MRLAPWDLGMIGMTPESTFWMFTEIQTHECLPGLFIGLHFSEDPNGNFLYYTICL